MRSTAAWGCDTSHMTPFEFTCKWDPGGPAYQRTEALPDGAHIPADLPPSLTRTAAEAIATAAHRPYTLREQWLNPPEWTRRVPEVIPLGMATSPYPDRIEAQLGHDKELAERTLTKLYNQRPAWRQAAHASLDTAVASAYGWADYRADMPDATLLARLVALNLARAG